MIPGQYCCLKSRQKLSFRWTPWVWDSVDTKQLLCAERNKQYFVTAPLWRQVLTLAQQGVQYKQIWNQEIFHNFSRWEFFETHLGKQIFMNSHFINAFMMNIHVLYRGVSDWDLTCMHVLGQIFYHRQLQSFKARHVKNKEYKQQCSCLNDSRFHLRNDSFNLQEHLPY